MDDNAAERFVKPTTIDGGNYLLSARHAEVKELPRCTRLCIDEARDIERYVKFAHHYPRSDYGFAPWDEDYLTKELRPYHDPDWPYYPPDYPYTP